MHAVKELIVREKELALLRPSIPLDEQVVQTPTFEEKEMTSYQSQVTIMQLVNDFEPKDEGDNSYTWEISNTTKWKKNVEAEVYNRMHELDKAEEIIFAFKLNHTYKSSSATKNLTEKMAKIILELPDKFAFKKVSIQDPYTLDQHFEWEKFLFYTS